MILPDGSQYAEDIDIRERLHWASNRTKFYSRLVSWVDGKNGYRIGHAVDVPGIDGCFVRDWHSGEVVLLTEWSGLHTMKLYPERPIEQP